MWNERDVVEMVPESMPIKKEKLKSSSFLAFAAAVCAKKQIDAPRHLLIIIYEFFRQKYPHFRHLRSIIE